MQDNIQDSDVHALFALALADEPPAADGAGAVFDRARRIRTRQRFAFSATALGAVAVVLAVAVAVGTGGPAGRSGPGGQVALGVTTESGTPTVGVNGKPPASPDGHRSGAVHSMGTPVNVLPRLKSLLPPEWTVSHEVSQPGFAGLVLQDGSGKVLLQINVDSGWESVSSCAAWSGTGASSCTSGVLADGTQLLTRDGPNLESSRAGVVERAVQVFTTDGWRVVLVQWNAVDEKHGGPTRPDLLLSMDQMTAIALNPTWVS
jgi:hypothetical protein